MGLVLLTERYADQIGGVIHCFDRLIFQGVLPQIKLCQGDYRRLLCARAADQGFHAVGGAAEPDDSAEGGTGPGLEPGLVAVFSSVERCSTYKPLPDYYFYSIDAELGLCFVRVPTWAPFRVEIYCNGHNWPAGELRRRGIGYTQTDNAFTWIAGPARARKTSQHTAQRKAARYPGSTGAPVLPGGQYLKMSFRWTFHPAEYATDILFRQRQDLICMRR